MRKKILSVILILILICACVCIPVSATISESGAEVANQVNREGIVLLKNESNALPLKKNTKIAVFGEGQADFFDPSFHSLDKQRGYIPFGAGSAWSLNKLAPVAPIDALREYAGKGYIGIYEEVSKAYENDADYFPSESEVKTAAENADTAVVVISRWGGECKDFAKEAWQLTSKEESLITMLRASFKKVIAVLNTGNAIDTSWDEQVDALLFVCYGGRQGGTALAEILCGDVSPSGKLTSTWAKNLEDYPTTETFLKDSACQKYTEDIYLGYRYFETIPNGKEKVKYGFGYGLSYTDFSVEPAMKQEGNKITVTAKVTNTGSVAGKEVVQVYFAAPQGKLGKAAKALCAFGKTDLLAPGKSQTLTLTFDRDDMASYDDTGKTGNMSCYVLEAGDYTVYVGDSLASAAEAGKITVDSLQVVKKLSPQAITNLDERLTADGTSEKIDKIEKTEKEPDSEAEATPAPTPTPKPKNENEIVIEAEEFDDTEGEDGGPNGETLPASAMYYYADEDLWDTLEGENLANTWHGGAAAIYELTLDNGGEFQVSFRASTREDVTAVITLSVSDDGKTYKEALKSEMIPDTFTLNPDAVSKFHNFVDVKGTKTLSLPAGKAYLKLTFSGYPNVDCFTLTRKAGSKVTAAPTPAATPVPTPTPFAPEEPAAKDRYEPLSGVLYGKLTLDEFVAQMTTSELASFFVSYPGNTAGASDEVLLKYWLTRFSMRDSSQGTGEGSTSYPCETIMASTWNLRLAAAYALSLASETYTAKVDMVLTPAINLHRNPLAGRNFEYYSEDPFLSGRFAVEVVKNIQSAGVGACVKHFVCNEKETNKLSSDSRVSERALRELYLKPFEMAVTQSSPWGVMSSYNIVNGVPVSENADLLTHILREEWGFEGFVTGDWNNDKNIVKEINGGNDVREPSTNCDVNAILKAISAGKISRKTLEAGAKHILYVIMRSQSYAVKNTACGGEHDFADGICSKCHKFDEAYLETVNAKIKEFLNDTPENPNIPAEEQTGDTKKPLSPLVWIIPAAVVLVAGAVTAIVIKKKKS